ncbi:MAG: amidase family protein, partial [Pseudomonadota bacterium]
KANLHELAFGITSDNAAFGAVGNAADPTRFAGGSSGGTAVAIAAGIVPAGLGTDTGGSVRIPAALNGIVGFRPTTGRYSPAGVVPISHTRDTIGPMARSVADVMLLDGILAGGTPATVPALSDVRLGIATPHVNNLSAGVSAAFEAAKAAMLQGGATLVDVDLTAVVAAAGEAGFPIALYEAKTDLAAFLAEFQPGTTVEEVAAATASPDVNALFTSAILGEGAVPEAVYQQALESLPGIRAAYAALFDDNDLDAIIFPTTPLAAQPIKGTMETVELNGEQVPTFPTFIRNTDAASLIAAPGLSLPMGLTPEGLPVGLELDGRPQEDAALLALGLAIEAALADAR